MTNRTELLQRVPRRKLALPASVSELFSILGLLAHGSVLFSIFLFPSIFSSLFLIDVLLLGTVALLIASATSSQRSGIDFLITFFFAFFLAFPGSIQIRLGVFPWGAVLADQHLALGIALIAACQICYLVGQRIGLRHIEVQTKYVGLTKRAARFYLKWSWGLAVFAVFAAAIAGPETLFVARQDRPDGGFGGTTQQFLFIARSISLFAIVLMIYLARYCPHRKMKRQSLIGLCLFIPIFLAINYPPALSRFVLFGSLIAITCPFLDYRRPGLKLAMIGISVLFLLFIFPIAKIIADGELSIGEVVTSISSLDVRSSLVRADFDAFMQVVSTVQFLDDGHGGIRWGYNFLGVVLFFVPRTIWPTKPIDTGGIVSSGIGYWYTNVASPLPAEALMGFGLLGPFIVFGVLGYLVARIELTAGSPQSGTASLAPFVLYALTMGFIVIIMRGALNGIAPSFGSAFLAYGLMTFARKYNLVWRR